MERYSLIFSLPKNLYVANSPVLIEFGELYFDNTSGRYLILMGIKNLAENRIRSLRLCADVNGETVEYKYSGVDEGRGKIIGDIEPIYLSCEEASAFSVRSVEASFDNGSIWKCDEVEWSPLPTQAPITEALTEVQLAAFRELFGKGEYLPQKHLDLILCTCGTPNKKGDLRCSHCRCKLSGIADITKEELHREGIYYNAVNTVKTADIKALLEMKKVFDSLGDFKDSRARAQDCLDKIELIKAEENKVRNENQARSKKILKRSLCIGIPTFIVTCLILLTVFLFVPLAKYNSAISKMEVGNFAEARTEFRELNGYFDSSEKITLINGVDKLDGKDYVKAISAILKSGEPVTVVLDSKGGYVGSEKFVISNESENKEFEVPTKTGYIFEGWVLERCEYDRTNHLVLTFGATWNDTYKIEYDLAGGIAENPDIYRKDGREVKLNEPTKKGYNFIGWTGTDLEKPTIEVTIVQGSYGDRSYTANWEPCIYSITLDPKGGECDKTEIFVTYGEIYSLPTPTKDGFKFEGWTDGSKTYRGGVWSRDESVSLRALWS